MINRALPCVSLAFFLLSCCACVTELVRGPEQLMNQPSFSVTSIKPTVTPYMNTVLKNGIAVDVKFYKISIKVTGVLLDSGWVPHKALFSSAMAIGNSPVGTPIFNPGDTVPVNKVAKFNKSITYITPTFRPSSGTSRGPFKMTINLAQPAHRLRGVEYRIGKPATVDENRQFSRFKSFYPLRIR